MGEDQVLNMNLRVAVVGSQHCCEKRQCTTK